MMSARIALVTGTTSGIGLATVSALADAGWQVIATARSPERADALRDLAVARPEVQVRQLDVTSPASVDDCVAAVLADHGRIDLLVNNAGVGHRGTLEQISDEDLAESFAVNFSGVARTTRAVLPGMRSRRNGRVISVTSTDAVVGMPFSDAYNSAKFAVEGLMQGLAAVLRHFGVSISVVEPGPVRTRFLGNARGFTGDVAVDDPYFSLLTRYNGTMAGMLSGGQSPAEVAELITRVADEPHPSFRYQCSDAARAIAARTFVDPSGNSAIDATASLLLAPLT